MARCSDPDVDIEESAPFRNEEEFKTNTDAIKSAGLDEEHEKQAVGEECSDVGHFTSALDTFEHAEEDENPGCHTA